MALQGSGAISFSQIAAEFDDTTPYSMSEFYRNGSLVPNASQNANIATSGAIRFGAFYGATNRMQIALSIASNTTGYNILSEAQDSGDYEAGISDITVTVDSGVYVGSPAAGASYAMTADGFTSGDTITVVNNGYIIGAGGDGGRGGSCCASTAPSGEAGGRGIYANYAMTITNNGTIAGGGGGGGGGGCCKSHGGTLTGCGASGGGGGAGYVTGIYGSGTGGINGTGSNGTSGGFTSAGTGGGITYAFGGQQSGSYSGAAGNGGTLGQAGSSGQVSSVNYYDWVNQNGGSGGAAGYYAVGNSNITWDVEGTRLGQVS
jgi:hypothetical protein